MNLTCVATVQPPEAFFISSGDRQLVIAWSITAAVLLCAPVITRVLKEKGSLAVERLMGMLLVMVAVQMFLNGIEFYLKR